MRVRIGMTLAISFAGAVTACAALLGVDDVGYPGSDDAAVAADATAETAGRGASASQGCDRPRREWQPRRWRDVRVDGNPAVRGQLGHGLHLQALVFGIEHRKRAHWHLDRGFGLVDAKRDEHAALQWLCPRL